jgi:hypothetical protein
MSNSTNPYGIATSASAGNPSTTSIAATSIAANSAIAGNIGHPGPIGASWDMSSTLAIADNQTINIGSDFTITGRTLKACLKAMLPIAMVEYPEDFV